MKYEAKKASATVPVSAAASTPWVTISQTDAKTYSANVAGCTGCHLMTEAEWMTIAQNIAKNPYNWVSGTVGSGAMYKGHVDYIPLRTLAASIDNNQYSETGNSSGDQRRIMKLSNGEIIWDFAGNVWEWTQGQLTGGQPGIIGTTYDFREWSSINTLGKVMVNPKPSGTGIAGAASWSKSNNAATFGFRVTR